MLMLKHAIQERFPEGGEWATEALATIDDLGPESAVHDVASGWMKVGERDYRLVDTLFVLTEERLGFGQTTSGASERWVPLSAITAIDAIEGTGHPLESIEIHLAGGLAMLIGLPEPFVEVFVGVLQRQVDRDGASQAADFPEELAAPAAIADTSTLEHLPPSPWVETEVHDEPWAPEAPVPFDPVSFDPVSFETPAFAAPTLDDPPALPTFLPPSGPLTAATPESTSALLFDPSVPFDAPDAFEAPTTPPDPAVGFDLAAEPLGIDDFAVTAERDFQSATPDVGVSFFEEIDDLDPAAPGFLDVEASAGDLARGISWPEPFKGVSYLGGHADHPRKRKNAVLVFSSAGVAMTGGGMGGGQFAVAWAEVSSIDVQGADEVKFTHNQRIDLNSSAVIVELLSGDVLVFEVKLRRPATMRSTLAPILSFVRALRAQG